MEDAGDYLSTGMAGYLTVQQSSGYNVILPASVYAKRDQRVVCMSTSRQTLAPVDTNGKTEPPRAVPGRAKERSSKSSPDRHFLKPSETSWPDGSDIDMALGCLSSELDVY